MKRKILKNCRFLFASFLFLISFISFSQHLKKDGTPDKRYKQNKSSTSKSTTSHSTSKGKKKIYAYAAKRDAHGHIKRSSKAKHDFMKQSGYPHGRPGYVVDHIVPLKKGGCDCPSNMQWQTKEAAKAKDKWE